MSRAVRARDRGCRRAAAEWRRAHALALWVLLSAAGLGGCAAAPPAVTLADGPTGRITFRSVTLRMPQFLNGGAGGVPVEIRGDLRLPRGGAPRLPAVVIAHSIAGVGPHEREWARDLNDIGLATFVLNSFAGRGLRNLRERPGTFPPIVAIVDAYRALELLATHPRIDPERIALMGFSYGGVVTLYAGLRRFQRLHGPPGAAFAAHVAFYPFCNYSSSHNIG